MFVVIEHIHKLTIIFFCLFNIWVTQLPDLFQRWNTLGVFFAPLIYRYKYLEFAFTSPAMLMYKSYCFRTPSLIFLLNYAFFCDFVRSLLLPVFALIWGSYLLRIFLLISGVIGPALCSPSRRLQNLKDIKYRITKTRTKHRTNNGNNNRQ